MYAKMIDLRIVVLWSIGFIAKLTSHPPHQISLCPLLIVELVQYEKSRIFVVYLGRIEPLNRIIFYIAKRKQRNHSDLELYSEGLVIFLEMGVSMYLWLAENETRREQGSSDKNWT